MSFLPGLFISVEGGEGVGKSTFISGLTKELKAKGLSLVVTREPGGTKVADALREIFVSPPDPQERLLPLSELMIVSAGRLQHVENLIKPALKEGSWVLCDRYADSAMVYQLNKMSSASVEVAEQILRAGTCGLWPNLTFLLDCPVEVSMDRLRKRKLVDKAESQSRYDLADRSDQKDKRQAFLALAEKQKDRFAVLDASQSEEGTLKQGLLELEARFANSLARSRPS